MRIIMFTHKPAIALIVFCSFSSVSFAGTFYVSPQGNDTNAGTQNAPWETIDKANAKKLHVALSAPCFEFWYLLHFSFMTRSFSQKELIQELEKYNGILENILGIDEQKLADGVNLEYAKDTPKAVDNSIAKVETTRHNPPTTPTVVYKLHGLDT